MDTVVSDRWPEVDFFCFQEVWDRYFSLSLIQELRKSNFNYFLVDVARQSWHINHYFGSKLISSKCERSNFDPKNRTSKFPKRLNFQTKFEKSPPTLRELKKCAPGPRQKKG